MYIIGIPAFFFGVLYVNRHALHAPEDGSPAHPDHASMKSRFGFLYSSYKPNLWWWEIVTLSQKLLLTGLIIFIRPDTVSQLAAGFMISCSYMVLQVRFSPLKKKSEEELQFASNLAITLTLFYGILLKTKVDEEDAYGAVLIRALLLLVNIFVILLFVYQLYKNPMTGGESEMFVSFARKVLNRALEIARPKVMACVEDLCERMGINVAWLGLLVRLVEVAEAKIDEFTEQCNDLTAFMLKLKRMATAEEAIEVVDAVWLVIIQMLGEDLVEERTAELAGSIGGEVKVSLAAASASDTTQSLTATVVEASVSFAVLNGLCATWQEVEAVMEATGLRRSGGLGHVDLAVLEAEMNRVLTVFCTPMVAARVMLRMVPILRLNIECNSWLLEELMEKPHIQCTVVLLKEIERVAKEIEDDSVTQDSKALCLQFSSCSRMTDIPAMVEVIWRLACTILGEQRVRIMYRAVLEEIVSEARELSSLKWLAGDDPMPPQHDTQPTIASTHARDPQPALTLGDTEAQWLSDERRDTVRKLFTRYDLDDTGRVGSEELFQITMAVIYNLQLTVTPAQVETAIAELPDASQQLTFEEYVVWLKPNAMPGSNLSAPPSEPIDGSAAVDDAFAANLNAALPELFLRYLHPSRSMFSQLVSAGMIWTGREQSIVTRSSACSPPTWSPS